MHARYARLDARDPEFIRSALAPLSWLFHRYHDIDVTGLERLPEGRALVVGNHNGGTSTPDMFALMVAFWERFGPDAPAYGLAHDFVFRVPVLGALLSRVGAMPAGHGAAREALEAGAKVLVYPGGDLDAFKPSSRRHEVIFGGRKGFVRLALRARAPIAPVVSVGAHESFHVFTDGAAFARASGWKRLTRMEVLPVILGLPWGLYVGPFSHLPPPLRMKIRVLDPIAWPELDASAADDDAVVTRCYEQVRAVMQSALDEMVREGGFGRRPVRELLAPREAQPPRAGL